MTGAQYAEHLGVSPAAVSKAIKAGWLETAISWSTRGSLRVATLVDVPLADKLWMARPGAKAPALEVARAQESQARRTQPPAPPARAPSRPVPPDDEGDQQDVDPLESIAMARLQLEGYKAKLARQEFEKEAGILVETAKVKEIYGRQIQAAKTKVLAVGKLARSRIPHLTVDDSLLIDDLCREALEEVYAEALQAEQPPGGEP